MRAKFHSILTNSPELMALLPGGVREIGSLRSVPTQKPFAVTRFSFEQNRLSGMAKALYSAVWVHDVPGTYMRIDEALTLVRRVLEAAPSDGTFVSASWIENSVDFRDDDMGTIVKYARFRINYTTREG